MAVEHEFDREDPTNDDAKTIRTGILWTTIAHIITGFGCTFTCLEHGPARLDCWPDCVDQFRVCDLCFFVSFVRLLHVIGSRNRSFTDAVRVILGKKHAWMCGLLHYASFYGTAVAYVVTTSTCMK